jgi:hypothetical protein
MALKKFTIYSSDHPPASYVGEDELFVHLGIDRVEILVKNGTKKIPEALEIFSKEEDNDWPDTLKSIQRQSELLRRHFSERHLAYSFPDALVIPEAKFSSSSTKDLLDLIYGEQAHSWIGYKKMPRVLEMMLAFRVEEGIHHWVTENFSSYDSTHLYAEILQHLFSITHSADNCVAMHLDENYFILTLLVGGKLHLIQTFKYSTPEDVLYDLLNCLQQHQLTTKQCRLLLSGHVRSSDELAEQLVALFQSMEWQSIPPTGVFVQLKQQFPPHHFYLLQRWLS